MPAAASEAKQVTQGPMEGQAARILSGAEEVAAQNILSIYLRDYFTLHKCNTTAFIFSVMFHKDIINKQSMKMVHL